MGKLRAAVFLPMTARPRLPNISSIDGNAWIVVGEKYTDLRDSLKPAQRAEAKSDSSSFDQGVENIFRSAAYAALQSPIDGAVQLLNHAGVSVHAPKLIEAPTSNGFTTKAGELLGAAVEFGIIGKVVRVAAPSTFAADAATASWMRAGTTGATFALLSPSEDKNFWLHKAVDVATGFGTFAAMDKVANGYVSLSESNSLTNRIVGNTLGGVAGGAVNVAANDLVHWRAPSTNDASTVLQYGAFGGLLGVGSELARFPTALRTESVGRTGQFRSRPDGTKTASYGGGTNVETDGAGHIVETRSSARTKSSFRYDDEGNLSSVRVGRHEFNKDESGTWINARTNEPFAKSIEISSGGKLTVEPVDGGKTLISGQRPGDRIVFSLDNAIDVVHPVETVKLQMVGQETGEIPIGTNIRRSDASVARNELSATSQDVLDAPVHARFVRQMNVFEARMANNSEQIATTYHHLNRLLSADKGAVTAAQRMQLAQQILHEAAWPDQIDQGKFGTCNITASNQNRLYVRQPSQPARLITDVALTGKFVTADGTIVDMTKISHALAPFKEARNLNYAPFDANGYSDLKVDGQRNFADQIFQTTAVNVHWQRTDINEAGDRVRRASTIQDIAAGKPFQMGDLRYELSDYAPGERGEILLDHSSGEPKTVNHLEGDAKTMLNPLNGTLSQVKQTGAYEYPHLFTNHYFEISEQITGTPDVQYVGREAGAKPRRTVYSPSGLLDTLKELQADGQMPVSLGVDTRNSFFKKYKGGPHLLNVQSVTSDGRIEFTNQWGSESNYVGDKAVDPVTLYRAMSPSLISRQLSDDLVLGGAGLFASGVLISLPALVDWADEEQGNKRAPEPNRDVLNLHLSKQQ